MAKARSTGRQTRPTGPHWPINDKWKHDVQQRMIQRQVSKSQLARELGVNPSAITTLFKPETTQSRLVPRIHRILGLADTQRPAEVIAGDEFRALTQLWPDLSDEVRRMVLEMARLSARPRNG